MIFTIDQKKAPSKERCRLRLINFLTTLWWAKKNEGNEQERRGRVACTQVGEREVEKFQALVKV
jgi:hypothetical protein